MGVGVEVEVRVMVEGEGGSEGVQVWVVHVVRSRVQRCHFGALFSFTYACASSLTRLTHSPSLLPPLPLIHTLAPHLHTE